MNISAINELEIVKYKSDTYRFESDLIAIEEPLEIRLEFGPEQQKITRNVSVTMRTPGNDLELALGFLFTEGIIKSIDDVNDHSQDIFSCAENKENIIKISLKEHVVPVLQNLERNFYTTSSCGVCGKASIQAIRTNITAKDPEPEPFEFSAEVLQKLPDKLFTSQSLFKETGGLHASAIFDASGNLLLLREDVGRHNALDKIIGAAMSRGWLPLYNKILLLSGRISFELVQKAAMAGIQMVAAIGAPSSLAVQLAQEFNITLVGFLSSTRFNIYNAAYRIKIKDYENTH